MNGITDELLMWTNYDHPFNHDLHPIEFRNQSIFYCYDGTNIECRISQNPTDGSPVIWCDNKHMNILPLAIHYSVCQVFNLIDTIQIIFELSEREDFPETNRIDNLRLIGSPMEADEYDEFFEKVQVSNHLKISSPLEKGVIKEDSMLLSTNHLICNQRDWITMRHLINFNGKTAIITGGLHVSTQEIIDFLNNWINGGNENLEMIIVTLISSVPNIDLSWIQENFNFKPWDPKKRGGRFKYTAIHAYSHKTDLLDCTNAMDLERKTDNKLATVKIEKESFIFFVWNDPFPDSMDTISEKQQIVNPFTGKKREYHAYGRSEF
ncbi:hypothetical protein GCK72_009306 [Caenorhabditis remanei]|uniref:Sdz-33 F-box domain-containing protein n=1 Tax=Caenorhabditis remanei TaxID=31234 RepID=A0A6A5H3K2_CAERE|nr:hypothetical protein GCK72_009306 [Caenorhabditis remanei]KAF1761052.1 hypothetical protein GCK72_009306 [Caenorhabditis remanei]